MDGSLGTDFSIFVEGDNMENLFSKAKNCFKAKKKVSRKKQPGKLLIDNNRKKLFNFKKSSFSLQKKDSQSLMQPPGFTWGDTSEKNRN